MKHDTFTNESSGSVRCRVCGLSFILEIPEDQKLHEDYHKECANGILRYDIREFQKRIGRQMAKKDSVSIEKDSDRNQEIGKLLWAFSKWARARELGIKESDFDEYMADHLDFIDAEADGDWVKYKQAGYKMRKWEEYGG